ncbi:MAG: amidohydrolase [Flavobacteriales bacterium]|nr:amidohydrolase [Flavobacteriales bacterium]
MKAAITPERVKHALEAIHEAMVADRRHLHQHPELSFQERNTGTYIAQRLKALGIETREGIAGTGVIGVVRGAGTGPCISLRADIDALPIQETSDVPYRSRNAGVMHACGHDAHTAMVLGAGQVLQELRQDWNGTVLLLFQPGEEKIPGGASLVLKENALRDPVPKGIIGQHVTPELAVGKVGFHAGPFMASSDELYVTVRGKGGHAAMPATLVDPIVIAAKLLLALKEEFERYRQGRNLVLAFGKFIANGATNVVPNEVQLAGTLRTFDGTLRAELHTWLPRWAQEFCSSLGGSCVFEVRSGYPVVINDPALTATMRQAAVDYIGVENVVDMPQRMGSEDFAFYTQVMPGCFFRLGTGGNGAVKGLHTPDFDIEEDALVVGAGVMAWGALSALTS